MSDTAAPSRWVLIPWGVLAGCWLALTVDRLLGVATAGIAAGVAVAVSLTGVGVAVVVRYGNVAAGKLLAVALFAVGALATLLAASGGEAAWFPYDIVAAAADVLILAALLIVFALKTRRGRAVVTG